MNQGKQNLKTTSLEEELLEDMTTQDDMTSLVDRTSPEDTNTLETGGSTVPEDDLTRRQPHLKMTSPNLKLLEPNPNYKSK